MVKDGVKNIFLSASVPLPDRDPKYIETADIIAIRDAVIALVTVALPNHRIIWGGHPSITPLIYYVMDKLDLNIQEHVMLYQSLWFEDKFLEDNNKFKNIVFTEKQDNIPSSIRLMREKMFTENEFSAAVFIGGMNGIEDEYNMFREHHPNAIVLPIASTGAASKIVYDTLLPDSYKKQRLENDYGYMSLFQKILIDTRQHM